MLEDVGYLNIDKKVKDLAERVAKENKDFRNLPLDQQILAVTLYLERKDNKDFGAQRAIDNIIYRFPPPPIQEFLTEKYIGSLSSFYTKEKDTLWRRDLEEIFKPKTKIVEWICTGAIGTAKSSNSVLAHAYNLFRINCMRSPQAFMGSATGKPIVLYFMSVTLQKVGSTLLEPVRSLIRECPCYVEVKKQSEFPDYLNVSDKYIVPYIDYGNSLEFPNLVRIQGGSRDWHALGEDLFGASLDEAEFRPGYNTNRVFELYSQILERIRSRFVSRLEYCLMTLVSSIGSEVGVMNSYINSKLSARDPTCYISQYAIWDIKKPKVVDQYQEGYFYVLQGTRSHPSKILDNKEFMLYENGNYHIPAGCSVIKAPKFYLSDFKVSVDRALRNLAGVTSSEELMLFDMIGVLEIESKHLAPVMTINADISLESPLINQIPRTILRPTERGLLLYRYPSCLRYIHFDLAETSEAGFCLVHKEKGKNLEDLLVVDLALRFIARDRISLDAIREFAHDLIDKVGVRVHTITADQYQSTSLLQSFQKRKNSSIKKVSNLSVDIKSNPYDTLASIVGENRLRIGRMSILRSQLEGVYLTQQNKPASRRRKDIADALCGAVFNAISNPKDMPSNLFYNKNITSIFETSETKESQDEREKEMLDKGYKRLV